ncbi:MAG: glycosyltransferase, partial [Deinococcales bacterium]
MRTPDVTVVTVTHGRVPLLLRKREHLRAQSLPADRFEWRVLANGDPDAADALRGESTPFETTVLATRENLPIAAARNRAASGARGRVLLMSDDDCLPGPECLVAHLAAHAAHRASVVVGPLRLPDELRVGRRREPFERAARLGKHALWINATGANTSLPREAFEAVGGYDESFVAYGGEDPELALRLRGAGLRFRFEAAAWAYHAGRILGADPERAYLAGRAHRIVFERSRSLEVGLLLGVHPWLV